jgi:hypothetical protein
MLAAAAQPIFVPAPAASRRTEISVLCADRQGRARSTCGGCVGGECPRRPRLPRWQGTPRQRARRGCRVASSMGTSHNPDSQPTTTPINRLARAPTPHVVGSEYWRRQVLLTCTAPAAATEQCIEPKVRMLEQGWSCTAAEVRTSTREGKYPFETAGLPAIRSHSVACWFACVLSVLICWV